jgi:hemerythrin superfamily protein
MNITDALTAHHATLRQLALQAKTDPAMFDEFIRHLIVHHTMEEKYFYDFLEQKQEARYDALEAVNEHHIIELIIKDAESFPRDHERFAVKVESLGEYTSHHLDEEEAAVFPAAQPLFSEQEHAALGRLFLQAKDILLGAVPPEVPKGLVKSGAGRPKSSLLATASEAATARAAPAQEGDATSGRAGIGLGIGSLKGN